MLCIWVFVHALYLAHSSMNQELFKEHLYNHFTDNFHYV